MKKLLERILVCAAVLCLLVPAACRQLDPGASASFSAAAGEGSGPPPGPVLEPPEEVQLLPVQPPKPALETPGQSPEEQTPESPGNRTLYILMYHHFVPQDWPCNTWTVTGEKFRSDLEWLAEHGYTTVLPGQLAAGEPLPEKAVMLTLDDGYDSNYWLAYPLLQEFQSKAVISVIARYVEEQRFGYLTWNMCKVMAGSGLVEIGSHTYDAHPDGDRGIRRLEGESCEQYQARVLPDLQSSIDLIADNLGTAPSFFAYPNGKTEVWARDFIRDRFAVTVTTRHGVTDISQGLYAMNRFTVSMGVSLSEILPE